MLLIMLFNFSVLWKIEFCYVLYIVKLKNITLTKNGIIGINGRKLIIKHILKIGRKKVKKAIVDWYL